MIPNDVPLNPNTIGEQVYAAQSMPFRVVKKEFDRTTPPTSSHRTNSAQTQLLINHRPIISCVAHISCPPHVCRTHLVCHTYLRCITYTSHAPRIYHIRPAHIICTCSVVKYLDWLPVYPWSRKVDTAAVSTTLALPQHGISCILYATTPHAPIVVLSQLTLFRTVIVPPDVRLSHRLLLYTCLSPASAGLPGEDLAGFSSSARNGSQKPPGPLATRKRQGTISGEPHLSFS